MQGCNRGEAESRSVSDILERRQRQMEKNRRMLPPDFVHGEVAVGRIYEVLGREWAERALFAVDDGEVTTVAYYDDHFLVVEHWRAGDDHRWSEWWRARRANRDRVVTLAVDDTERLAGEATVPIEIDRGRFRELERGLLGVVRDGMRGGPVRDGRLCRGEVDVLSLVTLTSLLVEADEPA